MSLFLTSDKMTEECICQNKLTKKSNECPNYNTKQFDDGCPVMLELWEMQSISSLPSLPGPLWPGLVAPMCWLNKINLRTYVLEIELFWYENFLLM